VAVNEEYEQEVFQRLDMARDLEKADKPQEAARQYCFAADLLAQMGRLSEARQHLKTALALDPKCPYAIGNPESPGP
jgi:predicted RNA polymerase sigma factor